jgi:hypothetical protein
LEINVHYCHLHKIIYRLLFLVGIITCIELATRNAIQRLVDKGTPFIERIDKFKDFLKIDLNVTKALHDRKVSFGELLSHLLPINNVENVISHLGVLLDASFSETLKNLRHFQEPDRRSLKGSLAHLDINLTEEDMREARNEMWRGYTEDTDDEK